jgi:hypothetical protein
MAFFQKMDEILNDVAKPVFFGTIFMIYFVYIVTFLGLFYVNKMYISYLDTFIQVLIALILIFRFNPLRTNLQLQKYDVNIIFSSAIFLLTNAGLTQFVYGSILSNLEKIKDIFSIQ